MSGKVEFFDHRAQIVHPDHILPTDQAHTLPDFEPIYPLTAGVTLKTLLKAMQGALDLVPDLPEWIDPSVRTDKSWPSFAAAIAQAHAPIAEVDITGAAPARGAAGL